MSKILKVNKPSDYNSWVDQTDTHELIDIERWISEIVLRLKEGVSHLLPNEILEQYNNI